MDQISLGRSWMDRGFEERMESWAHSRNLRETPSPLSMSELFQEVGPRCPLEELEGKGGGHLFSAESSNMSLQRSSLSVEMAPTGSPHPSVALSLVASPQEWAERAQPLSSQSSLGDLYCCRLQLHAAGDLPELKKEEVPCMASGGMTLDGSSAGGLLTLGPSASFRPQPQPQPQRANMWLSSRSHSSYSAHREAAVARLDPARLPRHWVCPLAEIVDADDMARSLETYRRRRWGDKMEAWARCPATRPVVPVSRAAFFPHPPGVPFRALCRGVQFPTLSIGQPPPGFWSKLPLPRPKSRFLYTHRELPKVARSPRPQMWPGAKWPRGWEGDAMLLEKLWAGRTHAPSQRLDPGYKELPDPNRCPHPELHVHEGTSQLMWEPMVLLEAMKLAPGVSLWNPATQMLLRSGTPQQEDEEGDTSPPI